MNTNKNLKVIVNYHKLMKIVEHYVKTSPHGDCCELDITTNMKMIPVETNALWIIHNLKSLLTCSDPKELIRHRDSFKACIQNMGFNFGDDT